MDLHRRMNIMNNDMARDVVYTGQLCCNDGYYLCPNCYYQLIYKEDLTSEADFYYKHYCEFCSTKLNWTNRDTIGSQINKVDFLSKIFKIDKCLINRLTIDKVDGIMEDYIYCHDENDITKVRKKIESCIEEIKKMIIYETICN